MHKNFVKNNRKSYRKGGVRKPVRKRNTGGVLDVLASRAPGLIQNGVDAEGLQAAGAGIGGVAQQGVGALLRGGAEQAGMGIAGAAQGALGNLKGGLTSGKIGISAGTDLLAKGAEHLISKNSGTANDAFRTDSKQRTGAAVGGAVKGAGKGFDIGNKIIPGVGGAIGAGIGAIGGFFKGKNSLEKDRRASVRDLRATQNDQMKAAANQSDAFSSKAGAGFNTATSATKAYDQTSRAKMGGVRKLKGGNMSQLPGGAVQFNGAKHDQGGIMLDNQTEVEGGETMDKVNMKKKGGKAKDYIFSDYLKLGGKTFATRHKEILQNGGSQHKLQELAKFQEQKAGRSPKVMQEGGDRDPDTTDLLAGLEGYGTVEGGSGLSGVDELNRSATAAANTKTQKEYDEARKAADEIKASNAAKKSSAAEKGSHQEVDADGNVIYKGNAEVNTSENIGNWLKEREAEMLKLPEDQQNSELFDKYKGDDGEFDTTKFESDDARNEFADWYNELPDHLVSGKFAEAGKKGREEFGDQWNTRRILQEELDPDAVGEFRDVKFELNEPKDNGGGGSGTTGGGGRGRRMGDLLVGASQLIPPAYALLNKPKNVPGYAPQSYAKPQLPRVNFNAERASNASDMRATTASIENNAAGPAGMVNIIAAMGKKRQGDLTIATEESRANKQLATEEAKLGAQTSEFNIGQDANAQRFNRMNAREQIKSRREEVLGALDASADRLAGLYGDKLEYEGQERLATAISGNTGVMDRERLRQQYPNASEEDILGMLANMPQNKSQESGKKGGRKNRKKGKVLSSRSFAPGGPKEGTPNYDTNSRTGELTRKGRKQKEKAESENLRTGGYTSRRGRIKRTR